MKLSRAWTLSVASFSFLAVLAASAVLLVGRGTAAPEARISGEYVEARTCDVWTGPCFANGEMNLRGDNAVLAWHVTRGAHDGVDLRDLSIVAVLDAEGTLTTNVEGRVRSVIYVDRRASKEAASALIGFAKTLAPDYLKDVVRVETRDIAYRREGEDVLLEVGDEVKVRTTALSSGRDCICGNEAGYYPPLSALPSVQCAKTVEHAYSGSQLGPRWSDPNKRSAMLGRFAF